MQSVLLNLLANAIWVVLGVVIARAVFLLRIVRPTRNIWQIKDAKQLVIVLPTSATTHTGEYVRVRDMKVRVKPAGFPNSPQTDR